MDLTYLPTQQPQTPTPAPQNAGSSWSKWLPTAGSLVGSIGGDILGGLLTLPTGGVINPWDASTALSGLGAGLGQAGANLAQGKNPLQMNDLTQAGIGAAGNLAGVGVGKLLGMGGQALSDVGASQVAKSAIPNAVEQATTKNAIYGEAMNASNAPYLKNGFQNVLNNAENLGVNTLDKSAPTTMSQIGHAATGGSLDGQGFLNSQVDNILGSNGGTVNFAGDVNGDSLLSNLQKSAEQQNAKGLNVGNLSDTTVAGKQIAPVNNTVQQFTKQLASLSPKLQSETGTNLVANNMTTQEADNLAKSLSKIAFDNSPLPKDPIQADAVTAKRNMAKDLFSYVRGATDQQPGLNEAVAQLKQDPQLSAKIDQATANIADPQVRNAVKADLLTKINNANSIQDLRSAQSDYVDMSKLGDHVGQHISQNTYTTGAKKLAGLGQQVAGKSSNIKKALAIGGIADEMSGTKNKALKALGLVAAAPEAIDMLSGGGGASMAGNLLSKIGAGANVGGATLSSIAGAPQPNQQGGTMNNPQMPFMPDPYSTALLNAQRLQTEQTIDPTLFGTGASSNVQSLTSASQKYQAAIQGVRNLLDLYGKAGGGQGPIGGLLSSIQSSLTGGEASRYGGAAQQVAPLIAQITGAPSTANIPSIYENQPTSSANIQALINSLGATSNP